MKRLFLIALLLFGAINVQSQHVRVAAAANLRSTLDDIKQLYTRQHPGVTIDVTLGASGALLTQIVNGAQFDLFMAADKAFPDRLKSEGAASGDVKTYAFGRLALWSLTADVSKGPRILTDPSIAHITVAKPEIAPYGERAVQALKYYHVFDAVKHKIVYADNIAQAAQYAATGNADVGIVALSLVLAPEMKTRGTYFILDAKSYQPVEQACVLVKTENPNPEAAAFMKFVLSTACRPIFERYGYLLP